MSKNDFQKLVDRVRDVDEDAAIYMQYDARLLHSFRESGFLTNCFSFDETEQGEEYWWDIYKKVNYLHIGQIELSEVVSLPSGPTATDFLRAASSHMHDRATAYDSPNGERSMGRAITAFNAITQHELLESEGWLLLQILKDARQWSTKDYHQDSAEDCVAFSALKGESLARESHHE